MAKPTSKVLVINDEPLILKEFLKSLNAAARSLENPFGIMFIGALTAKEGLQLIERDGDVQIVIVDDKLYAVVEGGRRQAHRNGNSKETPRSLQMSALKLVQKITALRPELDLYILIEKEKEDQVVDALFAEAVDGYFYREERDFRGIYRILNAQIAERARTPFYDALRAYVLAAKDAWHTPGHSSGDSMRGSPWVNEFYEFMGEHVFDADLSVSVKALDSLMEPTGVIAEAQQMAAKAFGARKTFFATNGTSTANKVILQTLIAPGEKLLLDRNCHKSVHHGVVLSGARPIYLDSSVNRKYGVFGPVPKATILRAIEDHPDAQLLVLTSCTYDGLRYDLRPIVEAAHAHNIKVLIDEAWFSHARFHPDLRPTALEAGADYVTQSAHKTLSAFSQAAFIHVNDGGFKEHLFRENFNMHTSTSPMYSLIASLDVGRKQAVLEGYKLLERTLMLADELRQQINSTGAFRVLELEDLLPDEVKDDHILLDPTKITVDISSCGLTVDELQQELFTRFNITVEKSTFNTITLLLTIGTTRSKCSRLYDALMRIAREKRAPRRLYRTPDIPGFTELVYLPRDAYYCGGELMPLLDDNDQPNANLVGRTCADQIVPYPPGIPVLVPGQLITESIVEYLIRYLRVQNKVELHGVVYQGYFPSIRVLTASEERRIAVLSEPTVARKAA
ncbi:MAG TPA: aminotransferase class I/II-fold pyridoxal phosphate-dependent enzyme [Burkholderiaceae bacterium]|jgi:arginine decarboxylase|nr:aminotransferase class I/II-fold pyridoxal phosphate-dependent enzyme [Burkholderiaceae bacterium]